MIDAKVPRKAVKSPPRRVLVVGFSRLAQPLAARLTNDAWSCNYSESGGTLASITSDIVYQVGGGPIVYPRLLAASRAAGTPVIKHWVGTDVLRTVLPHVRKQYLTNKVNHWAVTQWLADELRAADLGIEAKVVPLSVLQRTEPMPFPPPPLTIVVYAPANKWAFYRGRLILAIAEKFPDVRFLIVANDGSGLTAAPNVAFLGYRSDMGEIYRRSHALLRFVDHDGLSYMVMEAMEAGRHVIWDRPMPSVRLIADVPGIEREIETLDRELRAGVLAENEEGRAYTRATFLHTLVADQIRGEFEAVVEAGTRKRRT
jgi:hypothetical protein